MQQQYNREKKTVKSKITIAKKEHYAKKLSDCRGDSSATWDGIKEIVPNKKSYPETYEFENVSSKAEEFNRYFANIGRTTFDLTQQSGQNSRMPLTDPPTLVSGGSRVSFRPKPVDTNTIILTLKSLNETRSVGSDGISFKFIKDSLYFTAFYLTIIINTSIVTGVFPQAWKHALVIPLFKKGDPNNVSNYRPISLLPIASKILEKIISNQLLNFLETNVTLSNCQHGFRPRL